MLVLSRLVGEKIVIDAGAHRIVFTINEIARGTKVRLGIEAPREVQIYREEIAPNQTTTESK